MTTSGHVSSASVRACSGHGSGPDCPNVRIRRFAPAFLEGFQFDAPAAGRRLQAAVKLLRAMSRSGLRKLPDIVPMPLTNKQ